MHTRSGLLEQIKASTVTLEEAGAATLAFLQEHITEPRTVPLCGNSIGMDRRFLAAYLPEIEEYLHYRSVDVSTIKELARRWYPKDLGGRPRAPRPIGPWTTSGVRRPSCGTGGSTCSAPPADGRRAPGAPGRPGGGGRGRARHPAGPAADPPARPGPRELLRAGGRAGRHAGRPRPARPGHELHPGAAPRLHRHPRRADAHRGGDPFAPRPLRRRRSAQGGAPLRRHGPPLVLHPVRRPHGGRPAGAGVRHGRPDRRRRPRRRPGGRPVQPPPGPRCSSAPVRSRTFQPRSTPWGEEGFRPGAGELEAMRTWDDLSKQGLLSLTPTVRVDDLEMVSRSDGGTGRWSTPPATPGTTSACSTPPTACCCPATTCCPPSRPTSPASPPARTRWRSSWPPWSGSPPSPA